MQHEEEKCTLSEMAGKICSDEMLAGVDPNQRKEGKNYAVFKFHSSLCYAIFLMN